MPDGSRSRIVRWAACRTLPHSFATHLLEGGYGIPTPVATPNSRRFGNRWGITDVITTMAYTQVLNRRIAGITTILEMFAGLALAFSAGE